MTTVLIIEDEQSLARVLKSYLEREGYNVITSNRGDTGYELSLSEKIDLLLLDLNLPGMDGMEIAEKVIAQRDIPIIMITARVEELDRLSGLEAGADDYITKPFSPREVVARVKAVLRRASRFQRDERLVHAGTLEIDLDAHLVKKADKIIDLTPSEFEILLQMARTPGRVYTRLQLLEVTQGQSYEGYERTIDAHIKNLRAKLETDPHHPMLINTVFGVGYRFLPENE
ncbi:MAG TPA: response regulator transcription factor [Anaerolineaceae bacterium]|nr:response regulator transcription factor [Anaerolineaceae bacterium]